MSPMNLHRTTGRPDWADVDPARYNLWQKLAVATRGIVTPGNLTTFVGLGLVLAGLLVIAQQNYWLAGSLIVVGRFLDLVDGWLADMTGTKSPLGEFMDAGADKLETFAAIIVMYYTSLAPWWLLTALLLPHLAITLLATIARVRQRELHPSRLGKLSMAMLWVSLFGLIAGRLFDWGQIGSMAVAAVALVTISMTVGALIEYWRQLQLK